jgi:hypothetical protein
MQQVFDHWDYSQDVDWLEVQGYPIIKGVAEFWLSQLQEDTYTKIVPSSSIRATVPSTVEPLSDARIINSSFIRYSTLCCQSAQSTKNSIRHS